MIDLPFIGVVTQDQLVVIALLGLMLMPHSGAIEHTHTPEGKTKWRFGTFGCVASLVVVVITTYAILGLFGLAWASKP